MRKSVSILLILVLLVTMVLFFTSCKSETEKAIESFDKSIEVAEQQRRDAEKRLADIENYKYSQFILENSKP